jgi:hypothetical protein
MDKKAPAPKAAKPAKASTKTAASAAAAPAGPTCRAEKCKQPVRAKGYCRKHFIGWRRGKVGTKHRYETCSKEGCRKPTLPGGRCEEHKKGSAAAAPAAAA